MKKVFTALCILALSGTIAPTFAGRRQLILMLQQQALQKKALQQRLKDSLALAEVNKVMIGKAAQRAQKAEAQSERLVKQSAHDVAAAAQVRNDMQRIADLLTEALGAQTETLQNKLMTHKLKELEAYVAKLQKSEAKKTESATRAEVAVATAEHEIVQENITQLKVQDKRSAAALKIKRAARKAKKENEVKAEEMRKATEKRVETMSAVELALSKAGAL